MKRMVLLSAFLSLVIISSQAQTVDFSLPDSAKVSIDPAKFNYALFEEILLVKINEQRNGKGLSLLKEIFVLKRAAYDQASYMSEYNSIDQDDPGERAILYGGTRNVSELVAKTNLGGTAKATYGQAAASILERLMSSTSSLAILNGRMFEFVGISATVDAEGKYLYTSAIFGNKSSVAPKLDNSANAYISAKSFDLESFNSKICNKCDKVEHVNELASGISIEKNTIYLSCDNVKRIKQLIKTPTDGFAADIVSKNQFRCGRDNIINYSLPNKGIILKPLFFEDILNKNLEDAKSGKFKVKLGELPKNISADSIEVNLIVIQQDKICKNLFKSHVDPLQGIYEFKPVLWVRRDPKFPNDKPATLEAVDKAYCDRMCSRSSNTSQQDAANTCNCVVASYIMNFLNTESAVNQVYLKLEKSKTSGKFNADSLWMLEVAILLKTSIVTGLSELMRTNAANKLREIEPKLISISNNIALYAYFAQQGDYPRALKWLDPVILNGSIPEDIVFSYILYSTLSSTRVNSALLPRVMDIAKTMNQERFCKLFAPGGISFQVKENPMVKEIICTTCTQ